ncbi:hypothetical protein TNCV_4889861 [Trichonephila clavipes]|nr:hypothetical protein TNCV_4889861 [Trichonephila clavipes]
MHQKLMVDGTFPEAPHRSTPSPVTQVSNQCQFVSESDPVDDETDEDDDNNNDSSKGLLRLSSVNVKE